MSYFIIRKKQDKFEAIPILKTSSIEVSLSGMSFYVENNLQQIPFSEYVDLFSADDLRTFLETKKRIYCENDFRA